MHRNMARAAGSARQPPPLPGGPTQGTDGGAMRAACDGQWLDRLVPGFVLPFSAWTLYVQAMVFARASFDALLRGLPLVALAAVALTVGWFRLRDSGHADARADAHADTRVTAAAPPLAVLGGATLWVALWSAGMPFGVFWWGALLAMFAAWAWHLRAGRHASPEPGAAEQPSPVAARIAPWVVSCVALAAVVVVLVANRPAADDAFYQSIPATLLRWPDAPVLLHDTMYRLPGQPVMLPFYRLGNYDVVVAVIARLAGVDYLPVAYLFVPAVAAALCVLAWAWFLRRIAPERWVVLLPVVFACVMLLGEAGRAYGNFAFVRMVHGKSVLATGMVPVIAGAALAYMRHGGLRHWLLLLAAYVAALGVTASALFVAPAAAALGLAGAWSPGLARSRRFVLGMLPVAYLVGAAWLVGAGTHGAQALAAPSPTPMPSIPQMLVGTWGAWSTRVLLVALLSAWAFVRDPVRARYFSAGAFFFLLVALDPYTAPYVAAMSVGVKTYWRLTWALPLPFFLAVVVDGVAMRAIAAKPKALAAGACLALAGLSFMFAARSGTLLCSNGVTLGLPGPKVPPLEFAIAREVAARVPETDTVLAPEAVATWLPLFVAHPQLLGIRQMYLGLAFPPAETAERSNLMRYVAGEHRPHEAERWFVAAVERRRLAAVVFPRSTLWAGEIERTLRERGWQPLACGRYWIMAREDVVAATAARGAARPRCAALAAGAP